MQIRSGGWWVLSLSLLVSACGQEDLPGASFDIVSTGEENTCTPAPANGKEEFTYRLILDGSQVSVALGPDVFATGTLEGCTLNYTSVTWEEEREDGEIAWQIVGSAQVNIDDACPPEVNGEDWKGVEEFVVVGADEGSGLTAGCGYRSSLLGEAAKSG